MAAARARLVGGFPVPAVGRTPALAALVLAALPLAHAQSAKLNEPLPRGLSGEVRDVEISPDGEWAVYRANEDTTELALFSVPTKGGTPVELAGVFPLSARFKISPDSRFVVYEYEDLFLVPIDGSREPVVLAEDVPDFWYTPVGGRLLFIRATGIFSLPVEGGEPVLVAPFSTPLSTDGLEFSADGRWTVFRGSAGGRTDLYSAALDGSTGLLRLNGDLASRGDVRFRAIAPDSRRVVYVSDQDTRSVYELYSVPIDRSLAAVKLSGPLTRTRSLVEWSITPDSAHVVYRADQEQDEVYELFSAPIEGGVAPRKLNAPLPATGDVSEFQIAGSSTVVYAADQAVDQVLELYGVGIAHGAPRKLNLGPPGTWVGSFVVAPDASRVVYRSAGPSDGDLFSVPLPRGGTPIRLTALSSPAVVAQFEISADSSRVVYRLNQDFGLFSVPSAGGAAPRRLDDGGNVQFKFLLSPNDERVLYRADRDVPGVPELFSVPLDGSHAPLKLNRPLDEGVVVADVSWFEFGSLGTLGLFVVAIDVGEDEPLEELYSVRLEPREKPVLLYSGAVGKMRLSTDESRAIFTTLDLGGEGNRELYSVPSDGSAAPLLLNDPTGINFGVDRLVFGADGRTLFYSQDGSAAGVYRVSIDGSAPRRELTGWSFFASSAFPYALTPDESRIVVLGDGLERGHYELFSLPSDGSAPPVQLNDLAPPSGSRSYPFAITADGSRVVYLTDQETHLVFELFVVPIDGSAAPVKLSGTLPPGSRVASFTLHAATDRAVYLVSDASLALQLFSVPLDGSTGPVRLNPSLPAGRSVTDMRVAADRAQVVYRSDQLADERFELFCVAIDGSASARRLSGELVAGGDVTRSFEFAADGRVVYLADQRDDEVFELHSAPLDAPAAPLQLTGPHVAGGDVHSFLLSRDGRQVVFDADHDTDDVFELYAAPLDRIKGARKLNGPMVDGGNVRAPLFIGPDGKVVYLADEDQDTVNEVFLTSSSASRAERARKP